MTSSLISSFAHLVNRQKQVFNQQTFLPQSSEFVSLAAFRKVFIHKCLFEVFFVFVLFLIMKIMELLFLLKIIFYSFEMLL